MIGHGYYSAVYGASRHILAAADKKANGGIKGGVDPGQTAALTSAIKVIGLRQCGAEVAPSIDAKKRKALEIIA
jgi:hypothetical protein